MRTCLLFQKNSKLKWRVTPAVWVRWPIPILWEYKDTKPKSLWASVKGHRDTGCWVKGSNVQILAPSYSSVFIPQTSPPPAVMTSIFQRLLPSGKVFAIRLHKKRLHETGSSTSSHPSPPIADPPDSRLSEAADIIQLVSPMVQAVAGVIPVAGAPLQAVVGGLLSIIQVIDVGPPDLFRGIPSDCIPDNQAKQGRSR